LEKFNAIRFENINFQLNWSAPDVEPEYGFGMLGIPPRVPPAAALIVVMEVVQFFKVLAWCSIQGFLYALFT
jgi:hypothetical protein